MTASVLRRVVSFFAVMIVLIAATAGLAFAWDGPELEDMPEAAGTLLEEETPAVQTAYLSGGAEGHSLAVTPPSELS